MMPRMPLAQQKYAGRWALNKINRMFLIWAIIWLAWLLTFVGLAMLGQILLAVAFSVVSFIALWYKFCGALES
jgi:hypothetical protein